MEIRGCGRCEEMLTKMSRRRLLNWAPWMAMQLVAAKSDASTEEGKVPIRSVSEDRRKRNFAFAMEHEMVEYEIDLAEDKRRLFGRYVNAGDRVAEIGLGTGPNLKYYPMGVHVVGYEPNPFMDDYAYAKTGDDVDFLEVVHGRVEEVPEAQDGTFDVVVSTLTLCSVENLEVTLKRISRLLKPGGRFIFVEHVASSNPVLLGIQQWCDPLQGYFADGCHLTRRTEEAIRKETSWEIKDIRRFRLRDIGAILISPHICGVAIKT